MRPLVPCSAGLALSLCLLSSARAMPAADLSTAFEDMRGGLSTEKTALERQRALEAAKQAFVQSSIILMAPDSDKPLALAYDPAALERIRLYSDDPALLEQKTGHITAEQFQSKRVRLYVDLRAQKARLVYPEGELSFPVSTGNGRLPKHVWTPPGYYDVDKDSGRFRVYKMWRSRQAGDAPMPDSVFFKGGKAAHAATGSEVARLGTVPQSHGCVRMPPEAAARFRALVLQHGPENVGFYVYGVERTRAATAARPKRPAQRPAPLNILPPASGWIK